MTRRVARRTLDGYVVAVFGNRYDDPAGLAAPLLAAGASVQCCLLWSPYFNPPDDDDLAPLARLCVDEPGRVMLLTGLEGSSFYDVFEEPGGARRYVSWARQALGRLDAVVLGFETGLGWKADAFGRLLGRTAGEVIVIEGSAASSDQLTRRVAAASRRLVCSIIAMRQAGGGRRVRSDPSLGPVARALSAAGVAEPVTLGDVDRVAAGRRRSGADPVAGLAWRVVGSGDHDHGGCAVVTARSLASRARLRNLDRVPWDSGVTPLDSLGLDGIIVPGHNGIAVIEVAPSRSRVVAIRVGTLSDSFETDEPYGPIGEWRPRDLDVVIGDVWAVLVRGDGFGVRLRRQSRWTVDVATVDGEMSGFRVWSDSARELAANPGRWSVPSAHELPV